MKGSGSKSTDIPRLRARRVDLVKRIADLQRQLAEVDEAMAAVERPPIGGPAAKARRRTGPLSPRQAEVLSHLARGLRNREIAPVLEVSEKTIEAHRAQIKRRLGVRTTGGLIKAALALGLAPTPKAPESAGRLTDREREILGLMLKDMRPAEIAVALGISAKTVEAHRANLARKLGASRMADLLQAGLALGLGADEKGRRKK